MQRYQTPEKEYSRAKDKENYFKVEPHTRFVEYYDRSDLTEFDNQEKFKVRKLKKRRFEKLPSPIKFNLEVDYSPCM